MELEKAKANLRPPLPAPAKAPPLPEPAALGQVLSTTAEQRAEVDAVRSFVGTNSSPAAKSKPTIRTPVQPWSVGDAVSLTAVEGLPELEGLVGNISVADGTFFEVTLLKGEVVNFLITANLARPNPRIKHGGEQVYTPFSSGPKSSVQEQALLIRRELERLKAGAATDLLWPARFWTFVASVESLDPALSALVQSHGDLGAQSVSAPRSEELLKDLRSFEATGNPRAGASAALFEKVLEAAPVGIEGEGTSSAVDMAKWHSQLAPDLNRAAPEIYRTIRASGAASLRDWVTDLFPFEQRNSQVFQAKFTDASLVDFKVAKCKTHQELMQLLATDDSIEIILRGLASFIHHRRTGDADASSNMLAVRAPRSLADIAPSWMLADAATHSTAEHKRKERGSKQGGKGFASPSSAKAKAKQPKGKAKGGAPAPSRADG